MKRYTSIALLIAVLFSLKISAQRYRVYFTDKGENLEMLSEPFRFLSKESLERKAIHNIPVKASDLPVAKSYLQQLAEAGYEVDFTSRWFNFAMVEGAEPIDLMTFPFVKKVEATDYYQVALATDEEVAAAQVTDLEYGLAVNQVKMVNGDFLHDLGYTGRGKTIAVFDAGFIGTPALHGLDSLRESGRLKGTWNFVRNDSNVYRGGSHGTSVLSIMAGYIPDTFAGTAIHANYWLFKTEDEMRETPVEMLNWLAAAEYSDSVGVDVITSSLGYSKFDGGIGDYDISDLDGNTTLVTRAADMAASKGMLVVVSAGNSGNDPWQRITAPADGDSVLAVGAVNPSGTYAEFSSVGPTADGEIKPDVVAQGAPTAYLAFAGPSFGNGTSFSCPVVSGMAACLWQAYPTETNWGIYNAIKFNASRRFNPNLQLGFGIPNFRDASWELSEEEHEYEGFSLSVYPNPVGDNFSVLLDGIEAAADVEISLFDMSGQLLHSIKAVAENQKAIPVSHKLRSGTYMLSLKIGDEVYLKKIIK